MRSLTVEDLEACLFTDLWKEVREHLLPHFPTGKFQSRHYGTRWGYQSVDLDDGDLIIRILRERGMFEVQFLSLAALGELYSLNEVLTYLSLPEQPLMPPLDISDTLNSLRLLLESKEEVLRNAFDRKNYLVTRNRLLELREARRAARKTNARRL